jgi:hypothetical protein
MAWFDGAGIRAMVPGPYGSPCGNRAQPEATLGRFDRQDTRPVAVVITTDGRRVHMPIEGSSSDVSILAQLRSLLGLESLLGLITGSRRENGGTRRNER